MVLLLLSCVALAFVLNGLRPIRLGPLVIPAFFAAWLTVELAPQLLVLTVIGALVVLLTTSWTWVGVVVAAGVVAGLAWMVRVSLKAGALAVAAVGMPSMPSIPQWRRVFPRMSFTDPTVERLADVTYGDGHKRNRLDVYRSTSHPTAAPVLLQVHGGAWVIGDKSQQGRPLMLEMARRGWVCFAPNYRLSPRATFPDHLVDVKRAIAWVREHAPEYGGDPGFVVITGGSAGGHLAALAALTPNDPEYQPGFEGIDTTLQGCVPYYGVYDLENETGTASARVRHEKLMVKLVMKTREADAYRKASPLARLAAGAPPFLVIHGRNDTLVPVEEARLLVERLRANGNEVRYLELPGTEHAFDVFPSARSAAVVLAVARFCEDLRLSAPDRGR